MGIFTVCWSPCMCLELALHLLEAMLPAPTGQEYNIDEAIVVLEQLYFRFERAFPVFVRLLFLLPLISTVLYPIVFGAPCRLICCSDTCRNSLIDILIYRNSKSCVSRFGLSCNSSNEKKVEDARSAGWKPIKRRPRTWRTIYASYVTVHYSPTSTAPSAAAISAGARLHYY